jgi:hypothetical protein
VKNVKGKNRLTSFHIYLDGTVTFSDKKFPVVRDPLAGAETGQPEASSSQGAKWEWDAEYNMNKYWDVSLNAWVFWDTNESRSKHWDGTKWVWI